MVYYSQSYNKERISYFANKANLQLKKSFDLITKDNYFDLVYLYNISSLFPSLPLPSALKCFNIFVGKHAVLHCACLKSCCSMTLTGIEGNGPGWHTNTNHPVFDNNKLLVGNMYITYQLCQ